MKRRQFKTELQNKLPTGSIVEISSYLQVAEAAVRLPGTVANFGSAARMQFMNGVAATTGPQSSVRITTVTSGRRRLSGGVEVKYTVTTEDAEAAEQIAATMSNSSDFAIELIENINDASTGDIQGPRLPALQAGEVSTVTEVEFTTSVEVEVTVSADSAAGASRMEELASSTLKDSDSLAQISENSRVAGTPRVVVLESTVVVLVSQQALDARSVPNEEDNSGPSPQEEPGLHVMSLALGAAIAVAVLASGLAIVQYATNKRKQGHHATMASYRQQTVVASYLATIAMADDGVLPTGLVAAEFSSGVVVTASGPGRMSYASALVDDSPEPGASTKPSLVPPPPIPLTGKDGRKYQEP